MKHALTLLSPVVCCLLVVAMIAIGGTLITGHVLEAQQREDAPNPPKVAEDKKVVEEKGALEEVIQVDVTAKMFVGVGKLPGEKARWGAWLLVDGKHLGLDFSKNQAAQKQIRDLYGDPPTEPGSTYLKGRKVQVKGRLEFRGMIVEAGKDARSDGPVVVVETLKIVE